MEINTILSWLKTAPQLAGEPIYWNYLPCYAGWSLTIPKAETKTDILGNSRSTYKLKITRRITIQSNDERLLVLNTLDDLADWARQNPPPGTRLRVTGLPEFTSRNTSGIEDISITMTLTES